MTRISNSPAETQGIIFARVLGGIIAGSQGQMVLFMSFSYVTAAMIVILQNINHHHVFLTQHPWKERYLE